MRMSPDAKRADVGADVNVIIEKFGGLRPMAHKTGIPVTTIQGWKKRNAIPPNRLQDVYTAAEKYGIVLGDLLQAVQSQYSGGAAPVRFAVQAAHSPEAKPHTPVTPPIATPSASAAANYNANPDWKALERRALRKTLLVNVGLITLAVCALGILVWPQRAAMLLHPLGTGSSEDMQALQDKIATLEGDLAAMRAGQVPTEAPTDWQIQLAALQDQTRQMQDVLQQVLTQAPSAAQGVIGPQAGDLSTRLQALESNVQALSEAQSLQALRLRFEEMTQTITGQAQLSSAVDALNTVLGKFAASTVGDGTPQSLPDSLPAPIDDVLETARQNDPTLARTFSAVPPEELKAAALLLGLNQFRSALNRDQQPFDADLRLLESLVGKDDPDLVAALEKLAPHAQTGVLTPAGLSQELRTIAGESVVAGLKGEKLSITDQLRARFYSLFSIEKNGQPIIGSNSAATDTRAQDASIAQAQAALSHGDIRSAISVIQALSSSDGAAFAPWLDKAQASAMAQDLGVYLGQSISSTLRAGQANTAEPQVSIHPSIIDTPAMDDDSSDL